jgi:hypothetical protein
MLESLEMNGFMLVVWIVSIKQCAQKSTFLIWWSDLTDTQGGVANET